jgi:hypothetical protein
MEKLASYEEKELLNLHEAILIHNKILAMKNKVYLNNQASIAETLYNLEN